MDNFPTNSLPEEALLMDIKMLTKQFYQDIMKQINSIEARFAWYEKKLRENDAQVSALEDAVDNAYEKLQLADQEIEKLQTILEYRSSSDD